MLAIHWGKPSSQNSLYSRHQYLYQKSFPRERDPAGNIYQGNYFEELVYAIVVFGWISTRAGLQAGKFGQELTLQVTSRILFFFRETSVLLSVFQLIATATAAKSLQSCPTLCKPIDGSLPGSPVPRILQARTLEWVAISFSNA